MEIEKHVDEHQSVDWRGRPSNPSKHGGMIPAAFILGLQAFEIMAIAAVGNNLITYVTTEMHFSLSKAANVVTNFVGTIFLLALLGGYISDSYLGSFWTILIFGFLELSGFILLSVQAHVPQLKPPPCNVLTDGENCVEAKGFKAMIFFIALYLVALGSGCVKPNMLAYGGDQFKQDNPKQLKRLSTYFNAAYFAFSFGQLISLTILVWVQTHSGMDVGFGVSAAVMAIGLISLICGTLYYRNKPPQGSILTPIAQVPILNPYLSILTPKCFKYKFTLLFYFSKGNTLVIILFIIIYLSTTTLLQGTLEVHLLLAIYKMIMVSLSIF